MWPVLSLQKSGVYSLLAVTILSLMFVTVGRADFTDGLSIGDGSVRRTNFDEVLSLSENGRRISVTGTVECTAGEKVQIHVSITQRLVGAVAEGNWKGQCTGSLQTWGTDAVVSMKNGFEPGVAHGVGLGVTFSRGEATDSMQWLNEINLIRQ